jgi:carbon-monoxide dehydrogenase small subunit
VFIDGVLVNSCLVPMVQVRGTSVETIEGLASDSDLHPVQAAFIANGGAQCGICTPGMVLAAVSLLRQNPLPDEAQVRTALAGNLCRCTGYVKIVDSVLKAGREIAARSAP